MRDSMMEYLLLYSGAMSSFDWVTMIALLIISFIYLVAPVIGYPSSGRGYVLIFASMWILLAKLGVSVFKYAILFFWWTIGKNASWPIDDREILMVSSLLESSLFVGAMVLFVSGLGRLRRSLTGTSPTRRDSHED